MASVQWHPCRLWETPHAYHRLGRAADIDVDITSGLDGVINTDEELKMQKFLKAKGIQIHLHSDHWHIYLPGDGPL
jgi:hypothetical protein